MPWKQKLNQVTIDKPVSLTEFQTILHILYINLIWRKQLHRLKIMILSYNFNQVFDYS